MSDIERNHKQLEPAKIESDLHEDMPPLPINGLLYPVDMEDRRIIESFKFVVKKVINEVGGVTPTIEVADVEDPISRMLFPRILVSFETDKITDHQLEQFEEIARRAYGEDIQGIKNDQGKPAPTHLYPRTDARGRDKPVLETTIGWYIGPDYGTPTRMYKGIFAYRKIGKKDIASGVRARQDGEWFTQETLFDNSGKRYDGGSYLVEIREGGMFSSNGGKAMDGPYQTDLAEEIIYTSLILAGKELPPVQPGLTYDIYHEMNQIGLGSATQLPGLEEQIKLIERTLIVPLASPDLTKSLKGSPKSVGLIGQVGTGKTQIIKHFLRQKLGVMLVPVNVADFEQELLKTPDRRTILPRIRGVADKVGRNVVLIIEDLENLAHKDNPNSKLLLNELAGLYNSGYRVLWTTNHPEVFNPQLLEPERLGGKAVFCGLPGSEARKLILEQHLVKVSREKKLPIFNPKLISDTAQSTVEARDSILQAIAGSTNGFTPRYLKDIVIEAIDQFMYRIAKQEGKLHGLNETNLENQTFLWDDWYNALQEVYEVYDVKDRLEEDERLQKLIKPGTTGKKGDLGFVTTGQPVTHAIPVADYHLILQSRQSKDDSSGNS